MMRILSPRSVWTTTSNFSSWARPKMMNRFSLCECAGSGIVTERASPKTVAAASKLTLCLARFDCALCASHSKVNTVKIQTPFAPFVHPKLPLAARLGLCWGARPSRLPFPASRQKPFPKLNGSINGSGTRPVFSAGHPPPVPHRWRMLVIAGTRRVACAPAHLRRKGVGFAAL